MQDLLEKLTKVNEEQEDRYDPKKNLRSKIIDMFYEEKFSLEDEQRASSGTHLEFKKGDDVVKVFVSDR